MSAWIVITADNLLTFLNGPQANAIRTAARATGQTDRFTSAMQAVANRIRVEIQAAIGNQVSATAYALPPELMQPACNLIQEAMQAGLNLEMTEDQIRLCNDARDLIRRMSEGKVPISIPDDPLVPPTVQSGSAPSIVTKSRPRLDRRSTSGL